MRIFFFLLAIFLSLAAFVRTDGFTLQKIQGPLPSQIECILSDEVRGILAQPFHYLGKGRQCFVFASQDGRYVLKFFNQSYFNMPWYAFFNFAKEKAKRNKRRHFFENSYAIAFKEFGEEILYLHLAPTAHLPSQIISDPRGRKLSINLNRVPFVLQRKGELFYSALEAIYQKEGIEGLCREIKAFKAQIAARIEKQIADGDSDVEHNWGYVDGHIFHLDPGRLYYDPSLKEAERQKEEWRISTRKFKKWLKTHHPEAVELLRDCFFAINTE